MDNFRGINHSSILCRILDEILLLRYSSALSSTDFQFGFKKNSSTDLCSMVLKEIVANYTQEGSGVYCVFLDAVKAFDRVNYCKLFKCLLDRNIPPIIVRHLIGLYLGQETRINWNGTLSSFFPVQNGLKQGGVLSPMLFNVYIDSLIATLNSLGVGCYAGSILVGCLGYADDLTLLAPSPGALRRLLRTCEMIAPEISLSFNVAKTKALFILPKGGDLLGLSEFSISLSGFDIDWVNKWSHLGHVISNDLNDEQDILDKRLKLIRKINWVLCYFSELNSYTRMHLLQAYCMNCYGCVLWQLNHPKIELLTRVWRKGLRRALRIHKCTHCCLLPSLTGHPEMLDQFRIKQIKFLKKAMCNKNMIVSSIAHQAMFIRCMLSPLGNSFLTACLHYSISPGKDLSAMLSNIYHQLSKVSNMDIGSALLELLLIRDGFLCLDDFSMFEVNQFINIICTC